MAISGGHKRVDVVVTVGGSGSYRTGAVPEAMLGGSRVCVTGAQTRAAPEVIIERLALKPA